MIKLRRNAEEGGEDCAMADVCAGESGGVGDRLIGSDLHGAGKATSERSRDR